MKVCSYLITCSVDESDDFAEAYVNEFLTGNVAMSRARADELAQQLVPTIRAADVADVARRMMLDSADIIVTTPGQNAARKIAVDSLVHRVRLAATREMAPPAAEASAPVLITQLPRRGQIVSEATLPEIDAFEWTLSNGMHVILKPTAFAYNDIQMKLVLPGGASLASDADYASAYFSDGVIYRTGVGTLSGHQITRMIDGSSMTFTRNVSESDISFSATTQTHDLERVMQLMYLHLTQPRSDTVAFRQFVTRWSSSVVARTNDPDEIFDDSVAVITASHHPRVRDRVLPVAKTVSLDKSLEFRRARTSNSAAATLVIVGDFTLGNIRPLLIDYVASVPGGKREESRDNGVRFPARVTRRDLRAGTGPSARTQMVFEGELTRDMRAHEQLAVVRDIAEFTLSEKLRESLGATYNVSVASWMLPGPPLRYQLSISFRADPLRMDTLTTVVMRTLQDLQAHGPSNADFEKVKAGEVSALDNKLESNEYWVAELSWHARMNWALSGISRHQTQYSQLTLAGARGACARFLGTSRYVQVTMSPK